MNTKLLPVEPQPEYIESSGRWKWPLPQAACFPGCCTHVYTASREWWEYAPSEAKPHPMAEAVQLRDGKWYWAYSAPSPVEPTTNSVEVSRKLVDESDGGELQTVIARVKGLPRFRMETPYPSANKQPPDTVRHVMCKNGDWVRYAELQAVLEKATPAVSTPPEPPA